MSAEPDLVQVGPDGVLLVVRREDLADPDAAKWTERSDELSDLGSEPKAHVKKFLRKAIWGESTAAESYCE